MGFLASQVGALAAKEWLAIESVAHGLFVALLRIHALAQKIAEKTREASVPACSLDASPLSYVFFQCHGYIAQAA
jgi:hypothetical protein